MLWTDFFPAGISDGPDLPRHRIVGCDTESGRLREALAGASGILNVITHSNGVDTFFGPLVLCGLRAGLEARDSCRPVPACIAVDHCNRIDEPLESALRSDRLLSPHGISARILLLNVCHGLLLTGSFTAPAGACCAGCSVTARSAQS